MSIDWTVLGTWVGSIGTVAAFFVGFKQIRDERNDRKRKELRAQAEHITAYIAKENISRAVINVLNKSSEPIYEVVVFLDAFQGPEGHYYIDDHISFLSIVPPGNYYTEFARIDGGMSFHPGISIVFKDAKGNAWNRSARGELTMVDKDSHLSLFVAEAAPHNWTLPKECKDKP